jgi:hypothetical protein
MEDEMAGHVAYMGKMMNANNILFGKHEGKRPLGRPQYRWEDNVRMYLKEIRWECVNWMYLAQDRDQWWALVNMVQNLQVP